MVLAENDQGHDKQRKCNQLEGTSNPKVASLVRRDPEIHALAKRHLSSGQQELALLCIGIRVLTRVSFGVKVATRIHTFTMLGSWWAPAMPGIVDLIEIHRLPNAHRRLPLIQTAVRLIVAPVARHASTQLSRAGIGRDICRGMRNVPLMA